MNNLLPPQPTGEEIQDARLSSALTQLQAAQLLGYPSWQAFSYWENGHRPMPRAVWALFLLALNRHSGYTLKQLKTKKPPCIATKAA